VIPRPVLFESIRIATFNVYHSANGGAQILRTLSGCTVQATTLTCNDTGLGLSLLTTYRYAVAPRHATNWIGVRSALGNAA